jgi:CIC family chloride channel protein
VEFWQRLTRSPQTVMVLWGVLVGVAAGYGALLFRLVARWVTGVAWGTGGSSELLEALAATPAWMWVAIPAAGGLLVGILTRWLARGSPEHGVPEVIEAVAIRGGRMQIRTVGVKAAAAALTLGTGGSVGWEGPMVHLGAGVGSACGQALKASRARLRMLAAAGAAAGIAAIFNAPLAGVVFVLEVILADFGLRTIAPVVVAAVMATAAARFHLGDHVEFLAPGSVFHLLHPFEIGLCMGLGLVAGIVSSLWTRLMKLSETGFQAVPLPAWARPALGGALVGALALAFPMVLGLGYEGIRLTLDGAVPAALCLQLLVAKALATSLTVGSGGSGGVFAPALFLGAMLGAGFGELSGHLFGTASPPAVYAMVGMGALIAGAMRAPLTGIILVFEITNDVKLVLPLMGASILSFLVSTALERETIYTDVLRRKGIHLVGGRDEALLGRMRAKDFMLTTYHAVPAEAPLQVVRERLLDGTQRVLPVLDHGGRLHGVVTLDRVTDLIDVSAPEGLVVAADVDRGVTPLGLRATLDEALHALALQDLDAIPVAGDDGRVLGLLSRRDLLRAYDAALELRQME